MSGRADLLRENYRSRLDEYQSVCHENDRLIQQGIRPSPEQLAKEQEAAAAVDAARGELLAAISRGDH